MHLLANLVAGSPPIDLGPAPHAMRQLVVAYLQTPLGWLSIAIAMWMIGKVVSFTLRLFTASKKGDRW